MCPERQAGNSGIMDMDARFPPAVKCQVGFADMGDMDAATHAAASAPEVEWPLLACALAFAALYLWWGP